MFHGNAKMEISEATMIAALQEYFDARVQGGSAFLVKSVTKNGQYSNTFEVETTELPKAMPLPAPPSDRGESSD